MNTEYFPFSLQPSPCYFPPMPKDRLTKARRSWNMSRIRGKDTAPEKIVRSLLHKMGYRFRLHVRIPIPTGGTRSASPNATSPNSTQKKKSGTRVTRPSENSKLATRRSKFVTPDLVLPKYKTAIFVH